MPRRNRNKHRRDSRAHPRGEEGKKGVANKDILDQQFLQESEQPMHGKEKRQDK